jgi:hypothetical protein
MIIRKIEFSKNTDLQKYVSKLNSKSITAYEPGSMADLNQLIDYEKKRGTIKAIILIR